MGRQQFSQPINVVASSSRSVRSLFVTSNVSIPIAGSETLYVYPGAGLIARLRTMNCRMTNPAGALSGTMTMQLKVEATTSSVILVSFNAAFNSATFEFGSNTAIGTSSTLPATAEAILVALSQGSFTQVAPLVVKFINNTDVADVATRYINVLFEVEAVS